MSKARPSLPKVILFNGILLFLSLVFAVVLAEVAVRLVAPQQLIMARPDLWEPADTVGWLRRANIDAPVNTGQGTVRLIADSQGFRVGQKGRSSGLPVLFLGDSFVEALQVEYEQTMTSLLETGLTARLAQPIAVRNAGVGGYSPSQYYLRARTLLPGHDYRLVVTAVFVGNDAQPMRQDFFEPRASERHHFHMPRTLSRTGLVDATLRPLNDMLEERSHLFIMARKRLENLRMKVGLSPLYFPREFTRAEADADRWSVTADICRDIRDLAEQQGARALFVLIPTDFQVDREKFVRYLANFAVDSATVDLEQPTRRLTEEFGKRDLQFIDALPHFRAMQQQGKVLYGAVDPHLSADGHRVLADLIIPAAAQMLESASAFTKASAPPPAAAQQ